MKKSIPNEILLPEVARLIKEGHTVTITVRGNSMNPFLVDRRDRVTLGDFTTEQLQPGVAGGHRCARPVEAQMGDCPAAGLGEERADGASLGLDRG